ncbi:MAG: riboflavin biosynthesis protein RibF [Bacteroidales bacterium]|nr:riboflavin biosynthesis protein RibF [Lachnoclostridium sp.]MCM1383607.1 riboflavin biosynthesis protein RibF [Lachnoclostridium sp.]MCM1466393.1 riboflavin biosynthesis protein RibF [Bacteroidales bacterium]
MGVKTVEIISGTTDFYLNRETAVAMGKFDGVHIGHRRLLEEITGQEKLTSCVFTFDPSPAQFFGLGDGRELTTREEKRMLFERMGVDILIEFPLTKETAAISPESFVSDVLAGQLEARLIVAGTDLSFGAGGRGDGELLCKMGDELGFSVKIIDKVCLDGQEVSSTYIRSQVEAGNMELTELLLGIPYPVMGKVISGNRIGGAKLGFPTANLLPEGRKLLPPKGVYESEVICRGRRWKGITNVGCKPTVDNEGVMGVETYLYDFTEEIYGEPLEVYLKAFKRPEKRFESLEALKEQLRKDISL